MEAEHLSNICLCLEHAEHDGRTEEKLIVLKEWFKEFLWILWYFFCLKTCPYLNPMQSTWIQADQLQFFAKEQTFYSHFSSLRGWVFDIRKVGSIISKSIEAKSCIKTVLSIKRMSDTERGRLHERGEGTDRHHWGPMCVYVSFQGRWLWWSIFLYPSPLAQSPVNQSINQ